MRQRTATEIGAPKIPDVKWEDVGGLEDVKRAILDTGAAAAVTLTAVLVAGCPARRAFPGLAAFLCALL